MCKAFLQPLKDWLTTQHHKAMRRLLYRRQHRTTSDRRISNIDKFTSSESFNPGRQRKNNIIFIMTIICEIHNQNCLIVCRYLGLGMFSVHNRNYDSKLKRKTNNAPVCHYIRTALCFQASSFEVVFRRSRKLKTPRAPYTQRSKYRYCLPTESL